MTEIEELRRRIEALEQRPYASGFEQPAPSDAKPVVDPGNPGLPTVVGLRVLILSVTAAVGWTRKVIDPAVVFPGGIQGLLVEVQAKRTGSASVGDETLWVRPYESATETRLGYIRAGAGDDTGHCSLAVLPLPPGGDNAFDYRVVNSGGAPSSVSFEVYVVGYVR